MNPRPRDDQTEALRLRAEEEGVGMHATLLGAVDDHLARTAHEALARKAAKEQTAQWAEPPERLK
ncbi:CopG family transcriptional regulator [Streptomyces sp. Tu 3180]|uniref:CopG family transcriptional regulator n=1 Tax=Streptomyces sp. Tu 3180 TaxID=2682611 RepID=UPI00135B6E09|nr:CopG family transcriptional regulator [Streptomyces sp. Tu 3180]KAF3465685.1 CopG family transcriptional regulator [Streptomyces sp. Tu 3180]